METTNLIAVDLGASSGRLISGQFDGKQIKLKEQFRFSNNPVELNGSLYWDYLKIFQEIKYGLSIAMKDLGRLDGMSVDTWGVDYGLVTKKGELLFAPHSYRDSRTNGYEQMMAKSINNPELFRETGNQPAKINTNLQLFADVQRYPFIKDQVERVLLMPNLVNYFFSGIQENEFTIASTTGLLSAESRDWDYSTLDQLGIPRRWFSKLTTGGRVSGPILPAISAELQLNTDMQVISGVGHDTASALLALPISQQDRQQVAFISCGTWSIIGRQTSATVVSDEAYQAGLTNEGCFDGSNRLLRNLTGLWIIQELQKEWSYKGEVVGFSKMVAEAETSESNNAYIDPNAELFTSPGEMEEKIKRFLSDTQQPLPENRGQLIRVVIESLALSYKQAIDSLEHVTNKPINAIHMFGGGIQNEMLVRLTADFTGKPVITGPVEASVMGNIVSQLQVLDKLAPEATQAVMNNSFTVKRIVPSTQKDLADKYTSFKNAIESAKLVALS
ncbi:rhamnulokinase [Loigolactobacillus jiayinensis]|uniref:Rhamnulokinase family protein n=1 Tax=Loigolactobacillus jiayinensis TaxID=2486016 RepID=A0ABW1RCQ0_9LACO|nr:rhamnulokinase family protein [Loigolactobacillus jiayinensis]